LAQAGEGVVCRNFLGDWLVEGSDDLVYTQ